MPKFIKRPILIEAVKWNGDNLNEILLLTESEGVIRRSLSHKDKVITIRTLEGNMEANLGDWIIKGVKGELYPCKPDIFEATYKKVEE